MNHGAKRLRNGLLQAAMAAASLISWLAGSAGADGITPPAAAAAGAARGTAAAVDAGGAMDLGVQLFVGAVLLVTALCFGWLLYLMLTAPPEDEAAGPAASAAGREKDGLSPGMNSLLRLLPGAAAQAAADSGLGRLFRAWIGARLGHPGPM